MNTASLRRLLKTNRLGGDGPVCRSVEAQLRRKLKVPHAFLTTSGTHALEMALIALGVGPGDEVICPSFTFVSTANAVVRQGAVPVFCDILEDTLNLDPEDIRRKITRKTKAMIPVHYAGVACDMGQILFLARKHRLAVVEDAALAFGATYKGRPLGTLGDLGAFSFHQTKIPSCGEGGALVTRNKSLAQKIEVIREKGTNRSAFLRGETDRYEWLSIGSSYVLSDLLATVLKSELSGFPTVLRDRTRSFFYLKKRLAGLERRGSLSLPVVPELCKINGQIFYFLLDESTGMSRDVLLRRLNKNGIQASFHYLPLHESPFGRRLSRSLMDLPVTSRVSRSLVRLPLGPRFSRQALDRMAHTLELALEV